MVVLAFADPAVRSQCCDLAHVRRLWGRDAAWRLSHRLQQLEAMASLQDLDFMPFDSHRDGDGTMLITVTPDLALAIRPEPEHPVEGVAMQRIVITQVLRTSTLARST